MPGRMDNRTYRHAATGEEARLCVGLADRADSRPWWRIMLTRADGAPGEVAGQPAVTWHATARQARKGYRERLRALREEGWRRVE